MGIFKEYTLNKEYWSFRVAQAWIKAGAPEANEVCSISPSDFNEATAKRLLWGGPEEYSQADAPLLRYLERQCVSCGQQLTNQQDWRRHMRKVHKQTWEEAERHLSGTASKVQFVRPCKFCRVHFTKTPQLHNPKSAFHSFSSHIFNTMDDQSALKEVAKLWGTTSPMAPMSDDELVKDQPHKFPKTRGSLGCERQKGPGSRDRPQPRCQLNNSR